MDPRIPTHHRVKPSDRHPQSDAEHDPSNDPVPAFPLSVKRLNFAADYADPRAPDQMALVWRVDLMRLKSEWIHKNAAWEFWRSNTYDADARLIATLRDALAYALPIVERYAHTQGDNAEFHAEITKPIREALGLCSASAPAAENNERGSK